MCDVGERVCPKCGVLYKWHEFNHHGYFMCRACVAGEAIVCFSECQFYNKENHNLCFKLNPHLRGK